MTQQIGITIQEQKLQVPLTALLSMLAPAQEIPGTLLQAEPYLSAAPPLPAEIGADLQGGIYAGPMIENGRLVHLIAAKETLPDCEWDEAQKAAEDYEGGGYSDWYLPSKAELLIALAHIQDKFEKTWHWTATPYGGHHAWAVGFEYGYVNYWHRDSEFLVRPFRRLSI